MSEWSFLTNHARTLILIANNPDAVLLRSIASELGMTERTVYGMVADLASEGHIIKHRHGRRNRYTIQSHMHIPDRLSSSPTIGEMLDLLSDSDQRFPNVVATPPFRS